MNISRHSLELMFHMHPSLPQHFPYQDKNTRSAPSHTCTQSTESDIQTCTFIISDLPHVMKFNIFVTHPLSMTSEKKSLQLQAGNSEQGRQMQRHRQTEHRDRQRQSQYTS